MIDCMHHPFTTFALVLVAGTVGALIKALKL